MSNLLKNKPSVLLLLPDLERNDISFYCVDLSIKLKELGWNPIVVSAGGILLKELFRANINHVQLPINSHDFFQIYNNSKFIAKLVNDMNIDIVHANSRSSALSCLYAKRKTGVKFVTTVHKIYDNGLFFWKKFFNKFIVKSDITIVPSMYVAKYVIENYKINANKIAVISNWIDSNNFSADHHVSTERIISMANTLAIPEEKRVISVIGNYKKTRDIYVLIDAITQLNRKDIVVFIISNENINKSMLMKKINSLKLDSYVNVINDVDFSAIYSLSDVVINISSKYDSFNSEMLKIEAMGRIIVSTDLGSSSEIIIDNKTGKIVKSDSVNNLVDGINWALDLPEEDRKYISNEASKHAHFNFSQSVKIDNIIDLYKNLLD